MGYRLTKITTRTGDDGSTGLGDGTRVRKDTLRVEAMGDIDELNSILGVLCSEPMADYLSDKLRIIQNTLFDVGGELCIPTHRVVLEGQVLEMDEWISELNMGLQPLKEFILPGGSKTAALCHVARTVCRRAERHCVALSTSEDVSDLTLMYLNRLSDLLFVMARVANLNAELPDLLWQRRGS